MKAHRYSYVCVLSTDNYLDGALVLNENLKALNSRYGLVCVVNENLSQETLDTLKKFGIKTIKMKSRETTKQGQGYWKFTFDKLNIFSLVSYDKLVFIDLDMLLLDNIDELFSYDTPAMCLDLPWHSDEYNSGIMVIKPDLALYNDMLDKFFKSTKYYSGDQIFLNDYFKDAIYVLPAKYNVMRSIFIDSELLYKDCVRRNVIKFNDYNYKEPDNIKVIHYIRYLKPFMLDGEFVGDDYHIYKKYMDIVKEKKIS